MDIPDKIKKLTREQLEQIVHARRAVSLIPFLSVNGKARSACALRHRYWSEEINKYTNATIEVCIKQNMKDAVTMGTLVSAFESMGLGVIAKTDLTLDEYDTIIGPVISAFPELIVVNQDWEPVPMDNDSRLRPRVAYGLPPIDTRIPEKTKNFRKYRRTEDLEEAVDDINAEDLLAALKPKEKKLSEISKDDAFKAMLAKMKPGEKIETTITNIASPVEIEAEITEIEIDQEPAISTPRFLKITTEEGKFRLKDTDTGEYFGEVFNTPIEAIVWSAKNGMKIK